MFTKYTEVQYDETSFQQTVYLTPYVQELHEKAATMVSEGKTPSIYAYPGSLDRSYRRDWLDQAAAEEWEIFQLDIVTKYNLAITTYTIGNLT